MKKNFIRLLALLSITAFISGCVDNAEPIPIDPPTPTPHVYNLDGEFEETEYLKVDGKDIVTIGGDTIYLRGVNVGGLLVTERWMCATRLSHGTTDHYNLTNTLYERFGEEKTQKFWAKYRENYWNETDFENCVKMGMNVLRLPFSYMNVDPNYHNVRKKEGQEFNFDVLDDFIEGAAKHHIYVILDLHGAYGSQNGQDHSGQVFATADEVDFYSNEEKMNKTVHLWVELAKHYKDVVTIAAYDILNEPGEKAGSTTTRHWDFFDKCYDAIREIDVDRPIIMESCWDGANLPKRSAYGWENVIYSFHNYSGDYTVSGNLSSYKNKLDGVRQQNFAVPYYMGEFTCYNGEDIWTTILAYLNSEKWHWTSWSYKMSNSPERYGGWGIYFTGIHYMNVDIDDYDEMMDKLEYLDTSHVETVEMTFSSRNTLAKILKEYY